MVFGGLDLFNRDGGCSNQQKMAGVPGFEPGNAGIKTPCLAAWLHPNCFVLLGIPTIRVPNRATLISAH